MKYEKEELEKLINVENLPYTTIGEMYGVTANSIKKAALRLGIELKPRRKINPNENFSKNAKNNKPKFEKFSDEEFKEIINNSFGWTEITNGLGYKSLLNKDIRDRIIKRCESLGIELKLNKPSSILKRTKGEFISNSKNYQCYRSSVRRLAEQIYKNSIDDCKCVVCGYNKHIEVAHIKAVADFDDSATIAEINDINNLIGLCPNHHWEFDNGLLDITPYIHRRMEE